MLASLLMLFVLAQTPSTAAPKAAGTTAEAVITRAVAERMGTGVTVAVQLVDPAGIDGVFASAMPDPLGRLGGTITFTLTPAGARARPVRVRARVDVIARQVKALQPILRGHAVEAGDVEVLTAPVVGVPVRRLPSVDQIVGEKALRPIDRGQIIQPGFVAVRKVVQAGDTVTVVAIVGTVQVTAICVAADSGDPGDTVRVVNKTTHRTIRVRVVNKGMVEVIDGR
ncbi:MAG: flagellar basal body P-ring formation protein FlgA [Acidobacteria bacterium]|nr:flagellar basal body P-ring formation protein FlgA [Acidobacteriota bacterium]